MVNYFSNQGTYTHTHIKAEIDFLIIPPVVLLPVVLLLVLLCYRPRQKQP